MSNQQSITLVSAAERARINRAVLKWINTYSAAPTKINYEQLEDDKPSMALSTIQGAYKIAQYITGGYLAQLQFKLIYRMQPNGSTDKRLKADETLDTFADWLQNNLSSLHISGVNIRSLDINSAASIFAVYQNGDEDHQILLTLKYEVE